MCPSMSGGPSPSAVDPILAKLSALSRAFDSGTEREIGAVFSQAHSLPPEVKEVIGKYQSGELSRPQVRTILNEAFRVRQEQLAALNS